MDPQYCAGRRSAYCGALSSSIWISIPLEETSRASGARRPTPLFEPGSNNGVGLRAPLALEVSSSGMEIQILDDSAPQYADLRPAQYCGSIYDVVPAHRRALRQAGDRTGDGLAPLGG